MNSTEQWRDEAMNDALRMESRRGRGEEALLRHIRRHRPGEATFSLYPDRLQLMRFLTQEATDQRSLLSGSHDYESNNDTDVYWPYLGWYELWWKGARLEVILAPDYSKNGEHLCLGPDRAVLLDFAERLMEYTDRPAGRCLRYTEGWESATDLDQIIGQVTWDDLVLPPATLAGVREAIEGFLTHRETYAALGFAWKRGVLLIGPPGTGKTMLCKAAAAALPDLPFLYVRDLREEDKKESIEAVFKRARRLAPCILAFEDIDGMINDTNRSVFLNEMDGFQSNEGLLILASSNHPGKIDEALLKRPSRFDRVFQIGPPARPERQEFCRRVLSRSQLSERLSPLLDRDALARQIAERTEGFTPAYIKEVFLAAALQRAQDGATVLDERFAEAALSQVEELRQYLRKMRDPDALADLNMNGVGMGFRH